jgi:hypothetical protein
MSSELLGRWASLHWPRKKITAGHRGPPWSDVASAFWFSYELRLNRLFTSLSNVSSTPLVVAALFPQRFVTDGLNRVRVELYSWNGWARPGSSKLIKHGQPAGFCRKSRAYWARHNLVGRSLPHGGPAIGSGECFGSLILKRIAFCH